MYPGNEGIKSNLVHHIDKVQGIVSTEAGDRLDLILAHEDFLYERDGFMREEAVTD